MKTSKSHSEINWPLPCGLNESNALFTLNRTTHSSKTLVCVWYNLTWIRRYFVMKIVKKNSSKNNSIFFHYYRLLDAENRWWKKMDVQIIFKLNEFDNYLFSSIRLNFVFNFGWWRFLKTQLCDALSIRWIYQLANIQETSYYWYYYQGSTYSNHGYPLFSVEMTWYLVPTYL